MKLWQKRMTSLSLFPLGSKSEPPLPPPIGREVKLFLKTCSKPKNLMIERLTEGCKRKPPYKNIAKLIICTIPFDAFQLPCRDRLQS